jgi:hypothetical protein
MWFVSAADWVRIGLEAQQVIALRLIKVSAGGSAGQTEATRMVTEKAAAFAEAAMTLAMGGSARMVVRRYRTHVKANVRRLSRRKSR